MPLVYIYCHKLIVVEQDFHLNGRDFNIDAKIIIIERIEEKRIEQHYSGNRNTRSVLKLVFYRHCSCAHVNVIYYLYYIIINTIKL